MGGNDFLTDGGETINRGGGIVEGGKDTRGHYAYTILYRSKMIRIEQKRGIPLY